MYHLEFAAAVYHHLVIVLLLLVDDDQRVYVIKIYLSTSIAYIIVIAPTDAHMYKTLH